jgi:hypothetical protein
VAGVAGLALPTVAVAGDPPAVKVPPEGKARLAAARRGLEQFDLESVGVGDCYLVRMWARRVVDAELALCGRPTARKAALEAYLCRARNVERVVRAGHKAGVVALAEVLEAEFCRADAEALLAEEKARQADRE